MASHRQKNKSARWLDRLKRKALGWLQRTTRYFQQNTVKEVITTFLAWFVVFFLITLPIWSLTIFFILLFKYHPGIF